MLEFFEIKEGQPPGERVFAFKEDGRDAGRGVICLDGSDVRIKEIDVYANAPAAVYDFFVRALLGFLRGLCDIKIVADTRYNYLTNFGFRQNNGRLEISSGSIDLTGCCKKGGGNA